jgi:SAM-dependent methyltransferase
VTDDYEYRGLMAEAWDLLRGDTSTWPDRDFYRAIVEPRGGATLDVGCGTGRLLLDYLALGLDVDGVDNSPEMLAICRAKAEGAGLDIGGRLFEQEMDALALTRRYATILVPSSSFQLLTDPSGAARAMARFHHHLEPGGLLVMSIMSKLWPGKRTPPQMQWSEWYNTGQRARPGDGAIIRRWMRTRFDHEQRLEHEENRYEVLVDDVVIHTEHHARSPCVRWYSQDQMVEVYAEAGFTDVITTCGFSFEPASPTDTMFCVLGARASG